MSVEQAIKELQDALAKSREATEPHAQRLGYMRACIVAALRELRAPVETK